MCMLVETKADGVSTKFVSRCAMPHKLAEEHYTGATDEKMACEVGTYVWMQEHCSDIRIPKLHAFGFTQGDQV